MTHFLKKHGIVILLLCALIALIALMCSVPPVSRDALTHHLPVPKLYVQNGGIVEIPHIIYSYYPQLLDLLYCIPMVSGLDIIPKYLHFSFALLTAAALFVYLRKQLDAAYGLIAALFFLSIPVIVKLSVSVYVDLGLIFFSTASLIFLLTWHDSHFRFKWLFLAALCCGLALSTKYNGLITFFLLTLLTPIIYINKEKKLIRNSKENIQLKAVGAGLVFLIISLTIFSPWAVKNYIWTGNPLYPLYDTVFNSKNELETQPNHSMEKQMSHFVARKIIYKESFIKTATIPIRIFFQGEDDNPELFDGKLNPLLLILPIFAFLLPNRETGRSQFSNRIFLIFSALYVLIVFFMQDMRIRWIGPAIPPLTILSAFGLKNISLALTNTKRSAARPDVDTWQLKKLSVYSVLFIIAMLNSIYIYQLYKKIDPIPYIFDEISRADYIEKFRPEYAALNYANKNLSGKIKLLSFFLGNRMYYSDHDIRFDHSLFKHIVSDSENINEMARKLTDKNFTHFVINIPNFNAWLKSSYNAAEQEKIKRFFEEHTEKIFYKNGHGLYQLLLL